MSAVTRLARLEDKLRDAGMNLTFCRATRDRMQQEHERTMAGLADTEAMLEAEIDALSAEVPVARRESEAELRAEELAAAQARYLELKAEEDALAQRRLEMKELKNKIADLRADEGGGES